ncbi:unnamed protein product, partial [Didymodactylos carnosus]
RTLLFSSAARRRATRLRGVRETAQNGLIDQGYENDNEQQQTEQRDGRGLDEDEY